VVVLRDARAPSARSAHWTLYITDSGGVGGFLRFVNATIRDAETGTPVEPRPSLSLDGSEIRLLAGTDRLPPGGTLAIPQSLDYESPAARATLTVAVQLVDDHGNVVSQSTAARLE
jgi:hypothetical protein